MNQWGKRILPWIFAAAWLLVILALLMLCLRFTINSRNYFLKTYEAMDIEAQIGISAQDSANAIMAMIDYMEERRESIQLEVVEYGQTVEMFNRQEIDHMLDVRSLYQAFVRAQYMGLLALFVLGRALLRARRSNLALLGAIRGGWWRALVAFGVLLAVLGAYALIDFYDLWTRFHHVFFTNDLWLMDYETCRMIRICPLELFSGIIVRFTALGLCALAIVSLGVELLGRARKEAR